MDIQTARTLNALTARFYAEQAASFSATREGAWPGWHRVLGIAEETVWARRANEGDALCGAGSSGATGGVSQGGAAIGRDVAEECVEDRDASAAFGADACAKAEGAADEDFAGERSGMTRPAARTVFDAGCGNLRFERFLVSQRADVAWEFRAVDCCDDLARRGRALLDGLCDERAISVPPAVSYRHLDIVGALLGADAGGAACDASASSAARASGVECGDVESAGGAIVGMGAPDASTPAAPASLTLDVSCGDTGAPSLFDLGACDMAVAFGVLHHIPGARNRERLVAALVDAVRPGGIVAVSLWRFMDDARLAARARATSERACDELGISGLEQGDYLLGWQDAPGVWRYCHHFDEGEIARLASCVAGRMRLAAQFSSDGRTGALNEYLIWQRVE